MNEVGRPSSAKRSAPEEAFAIEVFDDTGLKAEAESRLRDNLKQLRAAQRSLQRFEEADLPEFERWKAAEFGERLTQVRELEAEYRELGTLINEVEDERYFSGRSYRACYEQVKYDREHPEERAAQEAEEAAWQEARRKEDPRWNEPEPDPRHARSHEEREEELKDLFCDAIGFDVNFDDPRIANAFAAFKRQFGFADAPSDAASAARGKSDPALASELKRTYRGLARKLHPDHRAPLESMAALRLDDLWHEAQEAYRRHDIDELRRIDAIIDIEIDGVSDTTELERIEQAAERHRQSLRELERTIRQARKSPAWMFSKKPALKKKWKALIEADLRETIALLAYRVAQCKAQIEKWSKPKTARKAAKRRKPAASQSKDTPDAAPPENELFEQMGFRF